jgi:hypothetical protein
MPTKTVGTYAPPAELTCVAHFTGTIDFLEGTRIASVRPLYIGKR